MTTQPTFEQIRSRTLEVAQADHEITLAKIPAIRALHEAREAKALEGIKKAKDLNELEYHALAGFEIDVEWVIEELMGL